MDYEKILKEALNNESLPFEVTSWIEEQFPQLVESEDERIGKQIKMFIISHSRNESNNKIDSWLAWIEKQSEKKLVDKVEPKFKVGDTVKDPYGDLYHIIEIMEDSYKTDDGRFILFKNEDAYSLWTIQDAKDGDLIYVSTEEKGIQAIFHKYKNDTIFFHCYLCADFAQGGYMPIGSVERTYPLQKTHYKSFFENLHVAGYEWDAEKKELKKVGQKSAEWSEEDEKILDSIIGDIYKADTLIGGKETASNKCSWLKNKLKSLRPQSQWKPSKEHLHTLEAVISDYTEQGLSYTKDSLNELYEQLKKNIVGV